MRKLFIFIFVLFSLSLSAQGYGVTGDIDDRVDGDTVAIMRLNNDSSVSDVYAFYHKFTCNMTSDEHDNVVLTLNYPSFTKIDLLAMPAKTQQKGYFQYIYYALDDDKLITEIGRASCRERV